MTKLSKVCFRCKIEKPISNFFVRTTSPDGFYTYCKSCSSLNNKKSYLRKKHKPDSNDLLKLVDLFIYGNSMVGETFTSVKEFKGRYWVSDFGRVVSCNYKKSCINFLKPNVLDYPSCYLLMLEKKLRIRIHRLVAKHFLLYDPIKTHVNHKDGVKVNNHVSNLEYVTPAENNHHATKNGLCDVKGEKNPSSKLTKDAVFEIRRLNEIGEQKIKIADQFGISAGHVGEIIRGINWGWLK